MIKKYLTPALLFLSVSALFYLWLDRSRIVENYAISQTVAKAEAKAKAEEKQRADYYAKENAKLLERNVEIAGNIDLITADNAKYRAMAKSSQAKIAAMQKCEDARIALDFELSGCITKSKLMSDGYVAQIDNLTLNHAETIRLKDREIGELVGMKSEYITKYTQTMSEYLKFRAKQPRQRTIFFLLGVAAGFVVHAL